MFPLQTDARKVRKFWVLVGMVVIFSLAVVAGDFKGEARKAT